jgi:hypothetical protein
MNFLFRNTCASSARMWRWRDNSSLGSMQLDAAHHQHQGSGSGSIGDVSRGFRSAFIRFTIARQR